MAIDFVGDLEKSVKKPDQPKEIDFVGDFEKESQDTAPVSPIETPKTDWDMRDYFESKESPGRVRNVTRTKILKMNPEQRQKWGTNSAIFDALRFQDKSDAETMEEIKKINPSVEFSQDETGKYMHLDGNKIKVFKEGDEGYKEFTLPLSMGSGSPDYNWRFHSTEEGRRGAVKNFVVGQIKQFDADKKVNPDDYVEFSKDSYGNDLVTVKKPFKRHGSTNYQPGTYYLNKPGLSMGDFDAVKPIFQDLQWSLAGSAGTAGMRWWLAVPAAGLIGGSGEYANQLQRSESDVERVILTGIFAGAGEGAGRVISKGISAGIKKYYARKLDKVAADISGKPGMKATDKDGNFSEEFLAVLKQKDIDPKELADQLNVEMDDYSGLTAREIQRVKDFKAIGAKGTKGQIKRDFKQMSKEEGLAKDVESGGPLREMHEQQQQAFQKKMDKLVTESGGTTNVEEAGRIIKTAAGKEDKGQRAVASRLYQAAEKATGNKSLISNDKFSKSMQNIIDDFEDVIPGTVKKRISQFTDGTRPLTLENVEKSLTKLVNARRKGLIKGTPEYTALTNIRKATDDLIMDMGQRGGQARSLYKLGRKKVSARKSEFNPKKILGKFIQEDKVPDEKAVSKFMAAPYKEMREAVQIYGRKGDRAIKNIRTVVLNDIRKTAQFDQGANTSTITNRSMKNAIKKYGWERLKIVLSKQQLQDLKLLQRVTSYQQFPRGVYNFSGTFSKLKNWITQLNKTQIGITFSAITKPMGEAAEEVARRGFADKATKASGFTPDGVTKFLFRLKSPSGKVKEIPVILPKKSRAISSAIGAEVGRDTSE